VSIEGVVAERAREMVVIPDINHLENTIFLISIDSRSRNTFCTKAQFVYVSS